MKMSAYPQAVSFRIQKTRAQVHLKRICNKGF